MADPIEVPGTDIKTALATGRKSHLDRPGWMSFIPGECLKPDSTMWSDDEKKNGLWVQQMYLNAKEEEEVVCDFSSKGAGAAAHFYQARRAMCGLANCVWKEALEEVDGKEVMVRTPEPDQWRSIPHLNKDTVWEELGPVGRGLLIMALGKANTPSEEARTQAALSFRLKG